MFTSSVHAILFDLDGTLRDSFPHGFETLLEYLAELGHSATSTQVWEGERWTHYYWAASLELAGDIQELGIENPEF